MNPKQLNLARAAYDVRVRVAIEPSQMIPFDQLSERFKRMWYEIAQATLIHWLNYVFKPALQATRCLTWEERVLHVIKVGVEKGHPSDHIIKIAFASFILELIDPSIAAHVSDPVTPIDHCGEFEAWFKAKCKIESPFQVIKQNPAIYENDEVQFAWETWQAARGIES